MVNSSDVTCQQELFLKFSGSLQFLKTVVAVLSCSGLLVSAKICISDI